MTTFYVPARTRVEPYINLVRGEGSNQQKYVDADKHLAEHDIIFERGCRIFSYAQGSDCDLTGTNATDLVIAICKNSPTGSLGTARGIINVGDTVIISVPTQGANGYTWRKVATVIDTITVTDTEIIYPTAGTVANYAAIAAADIDIMVVSREKSFRLSANEVAVSTKTGGFNATDAMVMKAASTSPTSGAGSYWASAATLEVAMNALCTPFDVGHTAAGVHRDRIITEDMLTLDALIGLKGNLIPDGWMQYYTGYGGYTKAYPLGYVAGATAPAVSAPVTTGTFGSTHDWDLKLRQGHSVISRAPTGGNIAQLLTRFKGRTLRYVVVYKHNVGTDDLTIRINDGVSSTDGVIDTSTAVGYTVFYVDKTMDAAASDFYVSILNDTGTAAGSQGYIAFTGLFFMSKSGAYWIPVGEEYYEIINLTFGWSALADNTFGTNNRVCDGAGDDPCVEGAIVGIHSVATLKTVDAGGSTDFGLYKCSSAGVEAEDATYIIRVPISTQYGRAEFTPNWYNGGAGDTSPIPVAGSPFYGSFLAWKVTAVGGGAPAGGRVLSKIWVVKG